MIGNDVVDLRDPERLAVDRHPRFDRRVFSDAEREALEASGAPERLRWILWAAKEAAYKVARKRDPETVFSPPRFEVELDATLRGRVRHEGRVFELRVDENEERVHALASESSLEEPEIVSRVIRTDEGAATVSRAVRAFACHDLATVLEIPVEELEVQKLGRIPVLTASDRPLDVDLSLSHHGRYLAFACDLRDGASSWRAERKPLAPVSPGEDPA